MKTELIQTILDSMYKHLDSGQIQHLKTVLHMALHEYSVSKQNTDLIVRTPDSYTYLEKFLMSKGAAGLSPNTLKNYRLTISMFLDCISRPLAELSDDDFIFYLERYRRIRKVSFCLRCFQNNTFLLRLYIRAELCNISAHDR